jgi:dipeptidyl aminopeptidase/acylaminoacyl peptidase
MAPMKPVRYAARDGLEIPAYLTTPRGKAAKDLPLVVLVHGGPWVDGDAWGFDPEVQFLASRGYAVLQPNFRGTTRYGWKHFRASFGQWGLSMQDDLADGVKWAVEQGIADPKRVCIYGASYGGYAALMGLATTPGLYRCGVNYVGVTDLPFFLTVSWADYSYSEFARHAARDMVGDPERDAQRLRDTSPTQLAARIKAPVLMAYGADDRRVPLEHGSRMKSALDRAGAKYEWMVMAGEGHGFRDPANQKTFYEAVEKFLAAHLRD